MQAIDSNLAPLVSEFNRQSYLVRALLIVSPT